MDKKYGIGKPRLTLGCCDQKEDRGIFISDDIFMNFQMWENEFGVGHETLCPVFRSVYHKLMGIRFNTLHMLCLGHIMRDPFISFSMAEVLFDDDKICMIMDELSGIPGHEW